MPTSNTSIRIPTIMRQQIKDVADRLGVESSDVIRICIKHALPLLRESAEFTEELFRRERVHHKK